MQTAQTSTFHAELLDLNAMDGCAASIPAKTLDALHAGITVPNLSGTLNKKHMDESYPRHEPNAEEKDELSTPERFCSGWPE